MQPGGESAERVAVNVEVVEALGEIHDVKQYNQTVSGRLRTSPTMHSDLRSFGVVDLRFCGVGGSCNR